MKTLFLAAFVFLFGCTQDENAKMTYGDTGLPKNCRAVIAVNISAWRNKEFRADEVLESIDRNCGANGHSWGK